MTSASDPVPENTLTVSLPDIVELARASGRQDDPLVRQDIARLVTYAETGRWNALRGKAEAERGGGQGVALIGKIAQTRVVKLAASLALDLLGPEGMLSGAAAAPEAAEVSQSHSFFAPASSIYGGTDEIQRNLVAQRTLGLPREPLLDKGAPFGEVLRRIGRGGGEPREPTQLP